MTKGLYVGSFDPITLGHLDIVRQACEVFDQVHIGIGLNSKKTGRFDRGMRSDLIFNAIQEVGLEGDRIHIHIYDGSMMQEARRIAPTALIRGLRQISDFGDEFTINGVWSRTMDIPITYFICKEKYLHVSSSTAKEMHRFGEDISWLVPNCVKKALDTVI